MEEETLISMLQTQNPILAEAVSLDYIRDRWAVQYPTKEQIDRIKSLKATNRKADKNTKG